MSGIFDSLDSYFSTSGGTGSPGKSGGAGYSSDSVSGGNTGQAGGSGYGASSDAAIFSNPFTQSFGGITNNQVVNSPGASPSNAQGILASPTAPLQSSGSGLAPLIYVLVGIAAALLIKRF